ncbi:hypothetical protein GDO78_004215 [Eleutherodactylus coqui]|uniref:Uncharacterized protein n=1 Tax=Eleutherodactylus coqui TaxID=57060 RepID=A0A8J6ERR4_ELECQ|nr:hypothetical protein GDO78_004215 [Eleutherodactylus coqui]
MHHSCCRVAVLPTTSNPSSRFTCLMHFTVWKLNLIGCHSQGDSSWKQFSYMRTSLKNRQSHTRQLRCNSMNPRTYVYPHTARN